MKRPAQYAVRLMHAARAFSIFALAATAILALAPVARASDEIKVIEGESYRLTAGLFERTDFIMMENTVDLDTKIRDDRVQYIAFDYRIECDLKFKDAGPQIFMKFERAAPYLYDAPVVIHNTLNTYVGKFGPYCNAELLPKLDEYWGDAALSYDLPLRFKGGLFSYSVGHGLALGGQYQNYGLELYTETDGFAWRAYSCWPDYSNKHLLGPYIEQEKPQGVDYEHSKAYYLATDIKTTAGMVTAQPYAGVLMDFSDLRRQNFFQTPTHDDILGTVGLSIDLAIEKLTLSFEWARNFGRAASSEEGFPDVEHRGYMVYAAASYDINGFVPRSQLVYASGNKLTTDMIDNGDTRYPGSKNNAFSVYSPLNGYLADAIYPSFLKMPLVAGGNGWGLNYGVRRPTTFADPGLMENIVLVDAGFDYAFTKKASMSFDWWYLATAQKGIGVYNGVPKVISPELGCETDIAFAYKATKHITLHADGGYFFPGPGYREERTDTAGSLFTPYVRGDGKADPAYQLELYVEVSF